MVRFLAIVAAALLILLGFLVAGRVIDHRPVPAPPPAVVPLALFADQPAGEWMPDAAPETWWWCAATQTLRPTAIGGGT